MANAHYNRGRRFEWQLKKELEASGWLAFRTAGSHGLFDILALDDNGNVRLIQCKTTNNGKKIEQLKREFNKILPFTNGYYTQQLAIKVKGRKGYILHTAEGNQ